MGSTIRDVPVHADSIAAITRSCPAALWLSEDSVQALSYGGFVLLQYALAWVARVQGEQLACHVV